MAKAPTPEALTQLMIGRIDSLPRRLADGARYLIDHPDDVVLLSMDLSQSRVEGVLSTL